MGDCVQPRDEAARRHKVIRAGRIFAGLWRRQRRIEKEDAWAGDEARRRIGGSCPAFGRALEQAQGRCSRGLRRADGRRPGRWRCGWAGLARFQRQRSEPRCLEQQEAAQERLGQSELQREARAFRAQQEGLRPVRPSPSPATIAAAATARRCQARPIWLRIVGWNTHFMHVSLAPPGTRSDWKRIIIQHRSVCALICR